VSLSYGRDTVVAAVNGHAIAGGCVPAAACDLRLRNTLAGYLGGLR
jgi:enoyl-CoA hydratase/carnithine racemase